MKSKLLLLLSILIFGCKSVSKNIQKNEPINGKIIREKSREYSIRVPKTWYAFIDRSHNKVTYAPVGVKLKENGFPSTTFSAWKTKRLYCRNKDLQKTVDCYINMVSKSFTDYKCQLLKVKHNIYGNYYLVKSVIDYKGTVFVDLKGFIKKGKNIFELHYSSKEKDFDKFLPDVQKMIESFRITE